MLWSVIGSPNSGALLTTTLLVSRALRERTVGRLAFRMTTATATEFIAASSNVGMESHGLWSRLQTPVLPRARFCTA